MPLLAAAALVALITAILNGVAVMYEARQETRRKEIERHSADTLAAALARCIDDSHARRRASPDCRTPKRPNECGTAPGGWLLI